MERESKKYHTNGTNINPSKISDARQYNYHLPNISTNCISSIWTHYTNVHVHWINSYNCNNFFSDRSIYIYWNRLQKVITEAKDHKKNYCHLSLCRKSKIMSLMTTWKKNISIPLSTTHFIFTIKSEFSFRFRYTFYGACGKINYVTLKCNVKREEEETVSSLTIIKTTTEQMYNMIKIIIVRAKLTWTNV